jgi:putative ABC transport system ATP-binding protein
MIRFEPKHNGYNAALDSGQAAGHLIELRKVIKVYRSAAGEFPAIRGIDLAVDEGEFVAIVGKSGSGKSTLVNMITGIDRPTSGEVWVGGTPVHALSENQIAAWRGRSVGVVFQFFQLLPTLTALENVTLPMDFCSVHRKKERRPRALALLESVGLAEQANKLPSTLSGGEQQRVAIARALANDPDIVMCDEPTGNLDSKTAQAVFRLFQDLVKAGKTIMMVTHDPELASLTSRTIELSDGRIVNRASAPRPTQTALPQPSAARPLILIPEGAYV